MGSIGASIPLIRQIRDGQLEGEKQVPAIALTAYVRAEDYQKAIDRGFQRHIAKPALPGELALAIADLLRSAARE